VVIAALVTALTAQVVTVRSSLTANADEPPGTACPRTAAAEDNWGAPNRAVDFHGPQSLDGWNVYNSWAVEWTSDRIVAYVDGVPWWSTTNTDHFPPRPMHLCVQLDNFGGDTRRGAQIMVDWVRQYPA